MSETYVLGICTQALYLILIVSAPMLVSALVVGLIISVIQATTQIQEQTLSFVPKIIATFVSVMIAGPWIGSSIAKFATQIFMTLPRITTNGGP
jgi:flagellar biosynthetic protein FliQ